MKKSTLNILLAGAIVGGAAYKLLWTTAEPKIEHHVSPLGLTDNEIKAAMFTGNDKEQVVWRDAASGRTLAESGFFEPMTFGSLLIPGYGGRIYFSSDKGFITEQAMPTNME